MARNTLPIKQLPSGRWLLRWHQDGRQPSKSFDTQAEAKTFWMTMQADRARGTWIDPRDAAVTFQSYAEEWRQGRVGARATANLIEISLRKHLYPTIGSVPLSKLRPTQLQNALAALRGELAPSSIKLVHQHLRQVLQAAVKDRLLASNPASGLTLPRVDPVELVIPTPEEVQAIAAAIGPRHRALVAVGAGLGLRQGEALGLSRDRVNFLKRTVTIDRQVKRAASGVAFGALKTERSYRTIPLPAGISEALARHIEQYPGDDPDGLLFTAPLGGHVRADGWNHSAWKPAAAAAGRPELGFHVLRHFYASALIRAGLSAPAVARRMGNSPAMVLSTYAHLWRDDDDRTREAVDQMLRAI